MDDIKHQNEIEMESQEAIVIVSGDAPSNVVSPKKKKKKSR